MVKPTWEPAEGPVPCDTDPSRGRGEMDLRATRLMTGLRMGNQPVLKTKRPRRGCLIPPRAEKALPISAGACPRQDSAPAAKSCENREAGDPQSGPRSPNSPACFGADSRWNVGSNPVIRETVV